VAEARPGWAGTFIPPTKLASPWLHHRPRTSEPDGESPPPEPIDSGTSAWSLGGEVNSQSAAGGDVESVLAVAGVHLVTVRAVTVTSSVGVTVGSPEAWAGAVLGAATLVFGLVQGLGWWAGLPQFPMVAFVMIIAMLHGRLQP
jgi:hypothetical protein